MAELTALAPGDSATRVRLSTYLSYAILTDLGELTRARAVVSEALYASDEGHGSLYACAPLLVLGRISGEQANSRAALESFRRAVALLETTEDTLHLARAQLACAEAAMIPGDGTPTSQRRISRAERLLRRPAPPLTRISPCSAVCRR